MIQQLCTRYTTCMLFNITILTIEKVKTIIGWYQMNSSAETLHATREFDTSSAHSAFCVPI